MFVYYIVTTVRMPTNPLHVTLLAPGCFSMVTQIEADGSEPPSSSAPADLNDAAVRATGTQAYEQALAAALRQPVPDMGALPVALYQFPIDAQTAVPEHCVCAELIHLQADKDNARLVPESALAISSDESQQLLDALNKLINADGLEVQRTAGGRCYLTGMPATGLDSWPAHAVANGKIANSLPRQAEAGDWRRFLTEVQMLFHSHPVNEVRAERGLLPINGMWFWGGNQSVQIEPMTDIALVANDVYAKGLSATLNLDIENAASSTWSELEQRYGQNSNINEIVIVDQAAYDAWLCGDHAALSIAKQQLHERWITPIQQAVFDGIVAEFVLDGCEGQAIVERQSNRSTTNSVGAGLLKKFSLKRFSAKKLFGPKKNIT